MKKILVTGATGFVGNHVIRTLLDGHHHVIASSSRPEVAGTASWRQQVQYTPFDLAEFDDAIDYYAYFDRPDLLIHLAWEGLPHYKEDFHLTCNYPRHAAWLKNLIRNGLQDITVIGTCLEYGSQEGCLREDMETHPANPYAIAKDALRKFLEDLKRRRPLVFRWIRLFYLYGEGQNPNSLLPQLDKALDNGESVFNMSPGDQLRDFLPVESAASYICRISLQDRITGIINCCSGTPVSVKDLVLLHMAKRNRHIALNLGYYPYPDYEPFAFWGDNTRLKSISS